MGSQLLGAQVPEHAPEPLLAKCPVWDNTLEKPTYAVCVCSSSELLQFYVFCAYVIKRSSMCSSSLPVCGPLWVWFAVGCTQRARGCGCGRVWWRRGDVHGWSPCSLERKMTVRLGFGGGGGGCESGSGLAALLTSGVEASGSQARHLGKGLQCQS